MSERYLYSVHPRKSIKNLSDIAVIRVPKSLSLTLEDVLTCLKSAVVYRRFANENRIERVTILNAERLHYAKFMTEEEYEKFLVAKAGDTKNVTAVATAPVVEESTVDHSEKEEKAVEPEVAVSTEEKETETDVENTTPDSEVTSEENAKTVEETETAAEEEKVVEPEIAEAPKVEVKVVEPEIAEAPKVEVKAPQNYNKNNNYHNGNKNKK